MAGSILCQDITQRIHQPVAKPSLVSSPSTRRAGDTKFEFIAKEGSTTLLGFESTSYDWLVVNGADGAKFHGEGVIEGIGGIFGFMLTGCDKGKGEDTFRIQIWSKGDSDTESLADDAMVYDNKMGSTENIFLSDDYSGTIIAGGRIHIHQPGSTMLRG